LDSSEQTISAIAHQGWNVVLLGEKSKKPIGSTWNITNNPDEIRHHLARGRNIGLVCGPESGIAVLDFDDIDLMLEMFTDLGPLRITVETGSQKVHCYVKWIPDLCAKLLWKGKKVGEVQRGPKLQHVVMPPSIHPNGNPYIWAVDPIAKIPALSVEWQIYLGGTTEEQARLEPLKHGFTLEQRVEFARKWLKHRRPAIQGQQGDIHTFITCASVAYDHDLDEDSAVLALQAWNQTCVPPWPEKDLRAKVRSALKSASGARGEKLDLYETSPRPDWIPNSKEGLEFLDVWRKREQFDKPLNAPVVCPLPEYSHNPIPD
jgi:hypothetical protein